MVPRAQGVIRRVGLEGLVWWQRGLRWLQGQGGGQGALCTVNDVAPRLIKKQGLDHIPVKYFNSLFYPTSYPAHNRTLPRIKQRSNIPDLSLEQRYEKALKGLEGAIYESLANAAQANDLSKSSLKHRRNGRRPRQNVHQSEQIPTPAVEKAIVK